MGLARACLTLTVASALVATGCSTAPSSAATVHTKASLSVTRSAPIKNESFAATGRVSTRFKRVVVLRSKSGSSWHTVKRARTSATGRYRFSGIRTSVARTYVVRVPATHHSGKRFGGVTTRTRTVRPVGQSASLDVMPGISQQGATPASSAAAKDVVVARFAPARPGRRVTISRQNADGSWSAVAVKGQRPDGTAYWFGHATPGSTFRATVAAASGAARLTSSQASYDWGAPGFSDEFTGSTLDTAKWGTRNEGMYIGSRTRSAPSSKAAALTGRGALKLMVLKDPHPNACKTPKQRKSCFLNGQISSVDGASPFRFQYGVVSARIKYPSQQGEHGSLWLQSSAPTGGSEIDVSEFFGKGYPKGGLATFLYSQKTHLKIGGVWSGASQLKPRNDDWWTSYHVFTVKWTKYRYIFLVDGRRLWSSTKAVSHVPEYPILSLLTSDWEVDRLQRTPSTMYVDWIKVWQ